MSNPKWRQDFIREMALRAPHVPIDSVRKFMRYAATLHRLAEASCDGDWPCDNGERKVVLCADCARLWVPSVLKGKARLCPDCRTENLVRALAAQHGVTPYFNGDPRGCVLSLHTGACETEACKWGKRVQDSNHHAIGVPS